MRALEFPASVLEFQNLVRPESLLLVVGILCLLGRTRSFRRRSIG